MKYIPFYISGPGCTPAQGTGLELELKSFDYFILYGLVSEICFVVAVGGGDGA